MTANSAYLEFACIRGKLGERHQYLTTVTAATLLRLVAAFVSDVVSNPESVLNQQVIKEQSKQLKTPDSVISYSPIMIAVFGDIDFIAMPDNPEFGLVRVPAFAEIKILDGLHRMAALVSAELPFSRLSSESVPIMFTPFASSEQFETARSSISTKPISVKSPSTRSLIKRTTQERTKDLLQLSPFLNLAVAVGKCSLAPRAQHLLPHSAFARACGPLFAALDRVNGSDSDRKIAEFWDYLYQTLKPWNEYFHHRIPASEIRSSSVLASTTVLVALGKLGAELLVRCPSTWKETVNRLSVLDWSRSTASGFEGVALQSGKLLKGDEAETSTLGYLRKICGLSA